MTDHAVDDDPIWPAVAGALAAIAWIAAVIGGAIVISIDRMRATCPVDRGMFVYHFHGDCVLRVAGETIVAVVLVLAAPFALLALARRTG